MTYFALNAAFLGAVAIVVALAALRFRRRGGGIRWRPVALAGGALLLVTAVFDNVMIGIGLVGYDPDRISGIRLGLAPIEDFAYAIAAALLLPALWHLTARHDADARSPDARDPEC
jgi:lycopene cyclase domain-containing protein